MQTPAPDKLLLGGIVRPRTGRTRISSRNGAGESPIQEILVAYRRSQLLMTAIELGLFDALAHGPLSAAALARRLGTAQRGTRALADALGPLKLLRKDSDRYVLTSLARRYLLRDGPSYQGDIVALNASFWRAWSHLAEVVKTGRPAWDLPLRHEEPPYVHPILHGAASSHAPEPTGPRATAEMRTFILAMDNIARPRVPRVLAATRLREVRHLLDLGGGPGTYALAFAEALPAARVTVFDRPLPATIAAERIAAAGLADRVTTIAGDFLCDGIGRGYDVVFASNVLHSLGAREARRLLRKVRTALVPGGRLVVQEFLANSQRTGPAQALIFSVNMVLLTREGTAYTYAELEELIRGAGFGPVTRRRVDEVCTVLLTRRT